MTYTDKAKEWLDGRIPPDATQAEYQWFRSGALTFASFLDSQQPMDRAIVPPENQIRVDHPRPQKIEELHNAKDGQLMKLGLDKPYPVSGPLIDKINELVRAYNSLINT